MSKGGMKKNRDVGLGSALERARFERVGDRDELEDVRTRE